MYKILNTRLLHEKRLKSKNLVVNKIINNTIVLFITLCNIVLIIVLMLYRLLVIFICLLISICTWPNILLCRIPISIPYGKYILKIIPIVISMLIILSIFKVIGLYCYCVVPLGNWRYALSFIIFTLLVWKDYKKSVHNKKVSGDEATKLISRTIMYIHDMYKYKATTLFANILENLLDLDIMRVDTYIIYKIKFLYKEWTWIKKSILYIKSKRKVNVDKKKYYEKSQKKSYVTNKNCNCIISAYATTCISNRKKYNKKKVGIYTNTKRYYGNAGSTISKVGNTVSKWGYNIDILGKKIAKEYTTEYTVIPQKLKVIPYDIGKDIIDSIGYKGDQSFSKYNTKVHAMIKKYGYKLSKIKVEKNNIQKSKNKKVKTKK